MNYDLTIDFNFENKKIIGISKDNLEAIYSLNVKAELCTSRDCDEYRTKNDRRIIINEYFYIIMKIDDDNYAKHFSLKHNSTFLMGNGTLIPITPAEEFMKVRDLILKFKVNTVQENGYLQINCKVIDDKNEESGRRMLQQSEEKYVAGDNLFLVSIEPEKEKIFDIKVIYIVVCIVLGFSFLVLVGCCIYKCMNKKNDQSIIYEVNREEATRVQLRTHNN